MKSDLGHYTITVTSTALEPVHRPWFAWWPWGRTVRLPVTRTLYVQHVEALDIPSLVAVVNPPTPAEVPQARVKAVK